MTTDERIVQHVHHGFQCKQEAVTRFIAHYEKIHGHKPDPADQIAFELGFMEAWRDSRFTWTLHNGYPGQPV